MTHMQMTLRELREEGYLQEANRRFFHPLGLALAVVEYAGNDRLMILDARDDPEGFIFDEADPPEWEKYERIDREWHTRVAKRREGLGYEIQPPRVP